MYIVHNPLAVSSLRLFHPNLMHLIYIVHKESDKYRITAAGTYQYESDGSKAKLLAYENELEPQLLTFDLNPTNDDLHRLNGSKKEKKLFIIHNACWRILKDYFYNAPIPLNRLADLLQRWSRGNPRQDDYFYRDPDYVTERKGRPQFTDQHLHNSLGPLDDLPQPSGAVTRQRRDKLRTNGSRDCFARLPLEMREIVAAYMSILDFYRLWFVSRTMAGCFSARRGFGKQGLKLTVSRIYCCS